MDGLKKIIYGVTDFPLMRRENACFVDRTALIPQCVTWLFQMDKFILIFLCLLPAVGEASLRSLMPVPQDADPKSPWMIRHRLVCATATNTSYDAVFIGDSFTRELERRRWKHWFGYGQLKGLNLGFAGDRTEHVLWRIANGELDSYRARTIVLTLGTDAAGELAADTVPGIRAVIDAVRAKQRTAHVILTSVPPRGRTLDDPERRRIDALNVALRRLCDDHTRIWADLNDLFLTSDGRLSRRFLSDGVHPTDEGCDVWINALLPTLRELRFIAGGQSTPYARLLPTSVADWRESGLPPEAVPDTRVNVEFPNRDRGPFGNAWWLNRLCGRRERIAELTGKTVDVVLMGDSITHFWELRHPESWKKFIRGRTVLNCGYGGDRTQDVLWRAQNGELDGFEAKAVVLLVGTNNATLGSPPEDIAEGIAACVAVIRKKQPQATVILHPIFPRGGEKTRASHEKARAVNDRVNAMIRSLADGTHVKWVDFNARWTPNGRDVPEALMADGIHPTDAGYDLWMQALEPVLDGICRR